MFIDQNGEYYIGDRRIPDDIEVPVRPSLFHEWIDGAWVLNANEKLKSEKQKQIDDIQNQFTDTLQFAVISGDPTAKAWVETNYAAILTLKSEMAAL